MGKHFGNLQKLKGVTYYSLSPVELNPFLLMVSGLKDVPRRLINTMAPAILPFVIGYLTYSWGKETYAQSLRKNPDDFKNDV